MRKILLVALAAVSLAALPKQADAAGIEGTLNLTGEVRVTFEGLIDWLDIDGSAGGGDGQALIGSTSTGYFDTYAFPDIATEKDLQQGDPALARDADGFLVTPLEDFETFDTALDGACLISPLTCNLDHPNLTFTLTQIIPCEDAAEFPATQCDAGLQSPFFFEESETGTTVFLAMAGIAFDTDHPELGISTWTGLWDATFVDMTAAELLALLSVPGNFIQTTYSAAKITVGPPVTEVPEPASLLLLGTGLVGLAGRASRKLRRQA